MEFWPIFDIFHGLRPYLCSKRGHLGFHKQATHRRRGDEPFLYSWVHYSWLGMALKWSILDQKWQARQLSKVVQKGSKGTKMVLTIRDPFWAHLNPFKPSQTKMIFLPQMYNVGFGRGALEQTINFLFEMVQKGPDVTKRVPNGQKHLGLQFRTLLDPYGMLTSLTCLAIFVCFIGVFFLGHPVL